MCRLAVGAQETGGSLTTAATTVCGDVAGAVAEAEAAAAAAAAAASCRSAGSWQCRAISPLPPSLLLFFCTQQQSAVAIKAVSAVLSTVNNKKEC